jgi:hypothetical protein
MSKLARLRKWLAPSEAARHLSSILGEPVTPADILRLGLDGSLVLSVQFRSPVRLFKSRMRRPSKKSASAGRSAQRGSPPSTRIAAPLEIWDLPMIGAERNSVEARHQALVGARPVSPRPPGGTFVRKLTGEIWEIGPPGGHPFDVAGPRLAIGLPSDCEIVVRTKALQEFEKTTGALAEASEKSPVAMVKPPEKPQGARERNTQLTVIAALCADLKIELGQRGAAKRIASATERIGAPVDADTISKLIKQIPAAVETRKK